MKKILLLVIFAFCAMGLVGCSDDDSNKVSDPSIILTTNDSSIKVDETLQVVATVNESYTLLFDSSNKEVAIISSTGMITALGVGETTITVSVVNEGKTTSKNFKLTVEEKSSDSSSDVTVSLTTTNSTIKVEETLQVVAIASEGATLTYATSNAATATISETGLVTAVAVGETTITVTATKEDKTAVKDLKVTVIAKDAVKADPVITLTTKDSTVYINESLQIEASANEDYTLTYESSNKDVVYINTKGKLTALAEGTAVITIKVKGHDDVFKTLNITAAKKQDEIDIPDINDVTEPVKITFRVPSGANATTLNTLLPDFNTAWAGKIEVELILTDGSYSGVREQTIYDLNANNGPTLVMGYPDHFAEYYNGGYLVDLQPYINHEEAGFLDDFVQAYLPENRISGSNRQIYGLPLNKSTEVMIYNKTVFDAMHYEIPETWDDLFGAGGLAETIIADCKAGKLDTILNSKGTTIVKKDKPSESLANNVFYPIAYDSTDNAFITMARQWGGVYTERVNVGKGYAVFNNTEVKTALAYFQEKATKGYFAIAETFDESYASNAFINLQCLMTIGSSAGVGYNKSATDEFELGVARIPYKDSSNRYVIQQGTNICILSQSTELERAAAWQLIKFLTSAETTVKYAMISGGYLPVRISGLNSATYQGYLAKDGADISNLETYSTTYYFSRAAQVALSYDNEYDGFTKFVDDAFVGSALIRDSVGTLFSKLIVNKADIEASILETLSTLGPSFEKK